MVWYLAAPKHRPRWLRVDRLLREHGIQKDDAAGREKSERRMERRRVQERDDAEWKPLERAWCLGCEEFRAKLLERIARRLQCGSWKSLRNQRCLRNKAQAKGEYL